MPTLHFKGKPLVQNHHLVVPFSELDAVKSRGLSKTPSLHDISRQGEVRGGAP
jgi:hypothetical protein